MSSLLYTVIIYPIIFILPAWVANGAPVIFGGGTPLDFGRKLGKKPIFGKHKTVRGTLAGFIAGFIIAGIESQFFPSLLLTGVMLTTGTMLGDLLGSFIKRRLGKREGYDMFLMDQYLFFLLALVFALPFGNFPVYQGLLVLVILTGVLHRGLNILAHKVNLKKVPW